ncbi:hypothetical protein GCM10011374_36240 [Kocuria dechangensis]|uniref:Uncharacterized protein n=1 Tax=Kocuria dechangensis TaxID=1176249 RepID=A0A917H720_9MICC|nr:hypothetical protein [Kocuria dechangensis]GGG68610.1 hypothetical protein GCM10011374_36240 [Kocuria dechangensis]
MTVALWVLLLAFFIARPALGDTWPVTGSISALWAAVVVLTVYGHAPFGMPEPVELAVSVALVPLAGIIAGRAARPLLAPEHA